MMVELTCASITDAAVLAVYRGATLAKRTIMNFPGKPSGDLLPINPVRNRIGLTSSQGTVASPFHTLPFLFW